MFCRQCGSEIPNKAKFCTFCGTKTVAPKPREDEAFNRPKANELADGQAKVASNEEPTAPSSSNDAVGSKGDSASEHSKSKDTTSASSFTASKQSSTAAAEESPIAQTDDVSETSVTENTTNVAPSAIDEPNDTTTIAESAAVQASDAVQEQANSQAATAQPNNLKAAVEQNKKRSRRRMPMILLIALALALATSVAFAAHYIYTNIWLPAQQEQMNSSESNSGTTNDQAGTAITGNPSNILQLGEILAMNPEDISGFLEQQGMSEGASIEDGEETFLPKDQTADMPLFTVWRIDDISNLDTEGKYFGQIGFGYENATLEIGIGEETTTNPYAKHQYATAAELESGKKPSSIVANNLGLKSNLSDNEISDFTSSVCRLGNPLAHHSFAAHYSRGLYTQQVKTFSGFVESKNNEQRYVWYLRLYDYLSDDQKTAYTPVSALVCIDENNAYDAIIEPSELYTKDQWDSADDEAKATMIANSVAQESFIRNDTCRLNVLTGEVETRSSANASWSESKTTDTIEDVYGLDRDSIKISGSDK